MYHGARPVRMLAICRIDARCWIVATIAGTGTAAVHGDHGPAREAGLARPHGATISPDGVAYIRTARGVSLTATTVVFGG